MWADERLADTSKLNQFTNANNQELTEVNFVLD
jgi:hypothetical protein